MKNWNCEAGMLAAAACQAALVLQDLDFLARRADFLVGQAIRLSPPAVAGVWLRLCCSVGQAVPPVIPIERR